MIAICITYNKKEEEEEEKGENKAQLASVLPLKEGLIMKLFHNEMHPETKKGFAQLSKINTIELGAAGRVHALALTRAPRRTYRRQDNKAGIKSIREEGLFFFFFFYCKNKNGCKRKIKKKCAGSYLQAMTYLPSFLFRAQLALAHTLKTGLELLLLLLLFSPLSIRGVFLILKRGIGHTWSH